MPPRRLDQSVQAVPFHSSIAPASPTETIRYRRDGTPVAVIVAGSPIVLEGVPSSQPAQDASLRNGQSVVGTVAVYTDVTLQNAARQALAESEERHRTLVENLPIGVYRTSPGDHGTFLVANRASLHMFGFESDEELACLNVSDVYANPADRRAFSERVMREGSVSDDIGQITGRRSSNGIRSHSTLSVVSWAHISAAVRLATMTPSSPPQPLLGQSIGDFVVRQGMVSQETA